MKNTWIRKLLVVLLLIIWVKPAYPQIPKRFDPLPLPYHLKAKRIILERVKKLYIAEGDVKIDQEDRHLEADWVCIDLKEQRATLKGNVFFRIGNDWIRASEAKIDLKTYQGTLYEARLFTSENHMYVSSDEISKTGKNTYFVKNATITSCDGDVPAWRFTVERLNIEVEGWATAHDVAFWANSFPLAYIPYLTLPIKTKRKTGFLFPYLSYSSKRDGFDITVPFFWAIKENMDATFYERYMGKRGFMQGIEYRYLLSENEKGIFFFDILSDHRGDIYFLWDEIPRTNKLRWWIRSKQEHILPYGFRYQLDLDLVSDQDYLREFTEGYNNYAACNKTFLKYFGRGFLNEEASLIRQSNVSLTKYWGIYDFIFEVKYNQNLDERADKKVEEYPFQQLPHIHFYRNDAPLLNTPLYLSLNTHDIYFYRQEGTTNGHRTHLEPTFSLPFSSHHLELLPKIKLKETVYNLKDHNYNRFLYYTSLEAKTDLWRFFHWPIKTLHHLEPRIVYEFQPHVNQEKLPQFDDLDRLPKINRLTYSLTNYFLRKEREWLWLKVSQTYYIHNQRLVPTEKRRSLSNILIETQFNPWPYTYLDSEISISPYGKGITYTHTHLNLKDWRDDSLRLDYQYRPGQTKDLSTGCYINLIPGWQAYVENQHSFMYYRDIETRVGIRYNAQCWGVELAYSDTFENRRALIIFSLKGIGEIKLGR